MSAAQHTRVFVLSIACTLLVCVCVLCSNRVCIKGDELSATAGLFMERLLVCFLCVSQTHTIYLNFTTRLKTNRKNVLKNPIILYQHII